MGQDEEVPQGEKKDFWEVIILVSQEELGEGVCVCAEISLSYCLTSTLLIRSRMCSNYYTNHAPVKPPGSSVF